eukprot:scaffold1_cov402-Prasinococcus_capsulatus_cf.AAC.27
MSSRDAQLSQREYVYRVTADTPGRASPGACQQRQQQQQQQQSARLGDRQARSLHSDTACARRCSPHSAAADPAVDPVTPGRSRGRASQGRQGGTPSEIHFTFAFCPLVPECWGAGLAANAAASVRRRAGTRSCCRTRRFSVAAGRRRAVRRKGRGTPKQAKLPTASRALAL